jgi:anti-anti-sigma factor
MAQASCRDSCVVNRARVCRRFYVVARWPIVAQAAIADRNVEMVEELRVEVSQSVRAWAVVVRGELDMQTAAQLERVLEDVIREGARLVTLDLEHVDFLDSSGLRVILAASNKLSEQDGELLLEGASPAVERVLEVTGLIERLKQTGHD